MLYIIALATYFLNKRKKEIESLKKIVDIGKKTNGVIKDVKKIYKHSNSGRIIEEYCLIISYIDPFNNIEKEFITPSVIFNPIKDLKSKECDVYIYKEKVYVTNYDVNTNNEQIIWKEDELKQYNSQIKNDNKMILIFEIIFLPITLIIFITIFFDIKSIIELFFN